MVQQTFFSFEQMLDFFRYLDKRTPLTYLECFLDFITIEIDKNAFEKARQEYEADAHTE